VNDGYTALIWAAIRARENILAFLLNKKADIYLCDKHGFTALDQAVVNGHYNSALMLKQAVLCSVNQGLLVKSPDFYELKKDIFVGFRVNLKEFIDKLNQEADSVDQLWVKKPSST
jgi:ankyrin repeat protein